MINGFEGPNRWLSNFWNAPVMFEGDMYQNNEAAFQAAKCKNIKERKKFLNLPPNEAKRLGRKVLLREDWEIIKYYIMRDIVLDKFQGNENLKQKLLDTKNEELIESNTWHDNIWGDCTCPKCKNVEGKNYLGRILMEVRNKLKKS